ncbi:MAG: LysR family transcriptional regulator [Chloroflexi bacterium]|nr:LysR family transcriptional regulator [Chloroflexota bacterium]
MLESRPGTSDPRAPSFDQLVTVHQLRLFRAVAEHGGFSRAGQALGLSQPAISHQLKELATTVGVPLIDVIGRRVQLTQAGDLLLEHSRRILAEFDAAGAALDELRGLRRGVLRVAGDTTVGAYVLPDVLGAFRDEHPATQVHLDVGNRQHVLELLVAGSVDFAVSGRPWDDPPFPLTVEPFLANNLIAVASPVHRLARRSRISLAEFAREPFIVREPGSGTRETAEETFAAAGLVLRPIMQLANNGAIKRAVARNLGVTIMSRYATSLELEIGRLVDLPVSGFPVRRQWHLVRPRDKQLGPLDEAFLAFVREGSWTSTIGRPMSTD